MADLIEKINEDLNVALKGGDEVAVSTLRFLISKINNAKIAKGEELSGDEVLGEIEKDAKRHRESIEAFEKGERAELAEKEKAELEVLTKYLPAQISDDEIAKIVDGVIEKVQAKGPGDMGKVMSQVMAEVKGKADGGRVSAIAKAKLG